MASIGYGQYNYSKGAFGNPQYEFAVASIDEVSGLTASASLTLKAVQLFLKPVDSLLLAL